MYHVKWSTKEHVRGLSVLVSKQFDRVALDIQNPPVIPGEEVLGTPTWMSQELSKRLGSGL